MSFEFGMRRTPPVEVADEPEEADVDEEEADPVAESATRPTSGLCSTRRTSSRCSTSSTAS